MHITGVSFQQPLLNAISSTEKVQQGAAMKVIKDMKNSGQDLINTLVGSLDKPINTNPKSVNSTFEKIM